MLPPLALGNDGAVNMGVQISLGDPAFSPFGYTPGSKIAGLHSNSMKFFVPGAVVLFSIVAASQSHPQGTRVPISPHSCQRICCHCFWW